MFCSECGQANADAAKFCMACGRPLTNVQTLQVNGQEGIPFAPPQMATPVAPDVAATPPLFTGGEEKTEESSLRAGTAGLLDDAQTVPYGGLPGDQSTPPAVNAPGSAPPPPAAPSAPTYRAFTPQSAMPQAGAPAAFPGAPVVYAASCRVCGSGMFANQARCPRCGAPAGMIVNANDPTANSYVPVGVPVMPPQSATGAPVGAANNSGQRGLVPPELQSGWNWGAAFLTFFWAIAHKIWWYVALQAILTTVLIAIMAAASPQDQTMNIVSGLCLILYFVICIVFRLYFGILGNRFAWRNRRFDSVNQFIEVQETWKPLGIVFGIIALLAGGGVGILFVIGMVAGMAAGMMK